MRRALLLLLVKLIAIGAVWFRFAWWFHTAPPLKISASERMLNQVLLVISAGLFSMVIALLDRANVMCVLKLTVGAGAGVILASAASSPSHSWESEIVAETFGKIVGAVAGYLVVLALLRSEATRSSSKNR